RTDTQTPRRGRIRTMRKMFMLICSLFIVLSTHGGLAATGATEAAPAATPADNGTSTGQRIGNVISAAVSTAFPAVTRITDAIWPPGSTNRRKNAAEAAPALQSAKDQLPA